MYIICECYDVEQLCLAVNIYLNEGYVCQGGKLLTNSNFKVQFNLFHRATAHYR